MTTADAAGQWGRMSEAQQPIFYGVVVKKIVFEFSQF
jgi:hypothetical protein